MAFSDIVFATRISSDIPSAVHIHAKKLSWVICLLELKCLNFVLCHSENPFISPASSNFDLYGLRSTYSSITYPRNVNLYGTIDNQFHWRLLATLSPLAGCEKRRGTGQSPGLKILETDLQTSIPPLHLILLLQQSTTDRKYAMQKLNPYAMLFVPINMELTEWS